MQKLILTAAIAFTTFASAIANAQDRYLNVGEDANGNPVLLDTASVQNGNYKLIMRGPGQVIIVSFFVDCRTNQTTLMSSATFDSQDNLILQNNEQKSAGVPATNTPVAVGGGYACGRR